MSVTDSCEDCTDEQLCRKHFIVGVALVALKMAPTEPGANT